VKIKTVVKNEIAQTRLLLKSIPAITLAVFCVSLVAMNLLANKLIVNESWIALDAGIIVSWVAFLVMDMIVKRFGPRAAIRITIIGIIINLAAVAVFNIAAVLPGAWGNGADTEINATMAGSWRVLLASTLAFILSSITNNVLHFLIKRRFKNNPNGFSAYAVSSYTSTIIAQFIDNLAFALLFTFAMGWITFTAAVMFAAVGAAAELLCQIIFSPIGYRVAEKWRREGVGDEYLRGQK
jgi:uncharacterized integral membrane protein (TIGR00697 family)